MIFYIYAIKANTCSKTYITYWNLSEICQWNGVFFLVRQIKMFKMLEDL